MYYTYVFLSSKDAERYTGATSDLRARVKDHEQGKVVSARSRRPLRLIYSEACLEAEDAYRREGYLKSGRDKKLERH